MITELVTFLIPTDITRDQVIALCENSAPTWKTNPELIQKNYLYYPYGGKGGRVHIWKTKAAALEDHGDALKTRIRDAFGANPEFANLEHAFC